MSEIRPVTIGAREVLKEFDEMWEAVSRIKEPARTVNRYHLVREFLKAVADGKTEIEVIP